MSAPILQVWSAPKCQTGAEPIGALPAFVSASITETLGGTESGSLVLPFDVAMTAGVAEGRVLRATIPLRGTVEWVITAVQDGDPSPTVTVQLGPLRQLLALRGLIRTETDGKTTLSFTPDPATPAQLITRYVLTNLAADHLEWLGLGTIEPADTLSLATFSAQSRGGLLTQLEQLTGAELTLRALANDAGYVIDLVRQRNVTLDPILLEGPASALAINRSRELQQAATVVMPLVDGELPLGEVAWTGGGAIGSGPFWIPLADPEGGAGPIQEDGQFVGSYLGLPDGSALAITNSRASDSAVQVSSLGSYAAGASVVLWADTQGRPVSEIASPSAVAQSRGRIVATVRVRGGGQERNRLINSGFADAAASWSNVNGSSLSTAVRRSDLNTTVSGLINGARAAGTGTGTPLAVDGLPANARFYRGDEIRVAGATCAVTADAIPTTAGALTLSISPGLPADLADDTPVTLNRRDVRTLTLYGDQSPLLAQLRFTDSNTSNLYESASGTLASTSGGYTSGNVVQLTYGAAASGIRAGYAFLNVGDPSTLTWSSYATDVFSVPIVTVVSLSGTTAVFEVASSFSGTLTAGTTRLRYYRQDSSWQVARVTAISGTTLTVVTESHPSIGYPSIYSNATSSFPMVGCDVVLADGSTWTYTQMRDTRTLKVSGAHSAGATSVAFKAQANIATRNWANGDTVTMSRAMSGSATISGITSTVQFTDEDGNPTLGMSATVSVSASNMEALVSGTDWDIGDIVFTIGASPWTVTAIGSGTMTLSNSGLSYTATPFATPVSVDATWTRTDTRTVSATANWGANGRATLTLSTALPTNATYPAGINVRSNWHPYSYGSFIRLHAAASGGATSIEVNGNDAFVASSDPTATLPVALYRVTASGSQLPIAGNTLYIAADATANGSGVASFTLTAANANAVSDNAAFTVARPALLTPLDRTTGSVLRLFANAGTASPAISANAVQSDAVAIAVLPGQTVRCNARAWFVVTPETLTASTAPVVALVNTGTNAILATAAVSAQAYTDAATEVAVTCSVDLTASATIALRLYGGAIGVPTRWHICKEAALYLGTDPAVPYFAGSRSRVAFQRGQQILAQRKSSARYTVRGLDQAALAATGTPVQLGQRARLRSQALGLDTTQRIVRLVWRWPGAELVEVECEALTPRFTDVE